MLLLVFALFHGLVAAQSTSVVCIPGQCLQGYSNTSIGAEISNPSLPSSVLLLPGTYSQTTNPELLHQLLTSSSSQFSFSPGFGNATSLPLNVELSPGMSSFQSVNYSGSSAFTPANSSSNAQLSANSLALSSNIWVAVNTSNQRVILWDSVPDLAQLPTQSSLTLIDIQSSSCSPVCSSAGTCSPTSNTCTCAPGFTGASCESCSPNFFGPTCQPCPSGCAQCDDGISGTGRCLEPQPVTGDPSTCNCLNGQCGSNGQCTCNTGWTTADNGTACAKCQDGFFQNSVGDCKVCAIGCTSCASPSGTCLTCQSGFTLSQNDPTQCIPAQETTSSGQVCPDGSFSSGSSCSPCDQSCSKCNGPTSNNCTLCASGSFAFNGSCVKADTNGVCEGTGLIADNNKHECDACGAKCTACKIPSFSVASTVSQLQCTTCLPGSFLSNGQCISACPSGTFVSPQDNFTCTACDSSCSTCSGSSTFCLSCPAGQQALNGKCVSSCPSGTFSSSNSTGGGVCSSCHPDCATCSGSSFSQCLTCPPTRPVLSSGRCLPTCSKNQFFDPTSGSCQACDSSCASCSGSGNGKCLSCSSSTSVLRNGQCVSTTCSSNTAVVQGLGICLSDLVVTPTSTSTPLPSITGISDPTTVVTSSSRPLQWWEILLMALGCAFIFLCILMCWRRRMRKKRAAKTKEFATAKQLPGGKGDWKYRLVRFGERFFGHRPSRRVPYPEGDGERVKMVDLESGVGGGLKRSSTYNTDKFLAGYDHRDGGQKSMRSGRSGAPSTLPSLKGSRSRTALENRLREKDRLGAPSLMSGPSLYSQITGNPRRTPETREPVKKYEDVDLLVPLASSESERNESRLSAGSFASSYYFRPTEAEAYKESVRPMLAAENRNYWLQPVKTGGSGKSNSRNPFNAI